MDANQTRLHLLLGQRDWGRCSHWSNDIETSSAKLADCWDASPPGTVGCDIDWDSTRNELILHQQPFSFAASKGDRPPSLSDANNYGSSDRRGAARDRFGNW